MTQEEILELLEKNKKKTKKKKKQKKKKKTKLNMRLTVEEVQKFKTVQDIIDYL